MRARAVSVVPAPRQAVVAQLAEQLIRNQQVAGSNPANGSSYRPADLETLMFSIVRSESIVVERSERNDDGSKTSF